MADKLDGDEILQRWKDGNRIYNFESYEGVKRLEKLLKCLGYDDVNHFLADNSGAIEAILEHHVVPELEHNQDWRAGLAMECAEHGDSHPMDEECPDEESEGDPA